MECILYNLFRQINENDIYTKGIKDISIIDIEESKRMNCSIKLLAYSSKEDNIITTFVSPVYNIIL